MLIRIISVESKKFPSFILCLEKGYQEFSFRYIVIGKALMGTSFSNIFFFLSVLFVLSVDCYPFALPIRCPFYLLTLPVCFAFFSYRSSKQGPMLKCA